MTPEQCEALRQRLARAEQAYEDLMIGKSIRVLVDQSGERVEFTPANANKLAAYIEQLRSQIADHCGGKKTVSGPLRFLF